MPLSNKEFDVVSTLIKEIKELKNKLDLTDKEIAILKNLKDRLENIEDIVNSDEFKHLLDSKVKYEISEAEKKDYHDHRSAEQGGPCFAKLGAYYVDDEE